MPGQVGEQENLLIQPLFPGQMLGCGLEGRFEAGGLLAGQQLSHPLFEMRFVTGLLVGGLRPAGKGDEDYLVADVEQVQQGQGLLLQLVEETPGGKAEGGAVGLVEQNEGRGGHGAASPRGSLGLVGRPRKGADNEQDNQGSQQQYQPLPQAHAAHAGVVQAPQESEVAERKWTGSTPVQQVDGQGNGRRRQPQEHGGIEEMQGGYW